MALPFPKHPYLEGNYAPILFECDAYDLPVQGALPECLVGTLYRNGPNPQYAPRDEHYHWFIGDGMIHAFHFGNGRMSYRNRWVRTPKWQAENSAGRALFGSWSNPATSDPSVREINGGVANTNIIFHAGRALALEEAHKPFEVDPVSLRSIGYYDFDGRLSGRFAAHPKIDPRTGELVFFAYSVGGHLTSTMAYGVINRAGTLTRLDTFPAPYASMVHDFIVTTKHVLFPVLPLTGSAERERIGGPAFAWEAQKDSWVGIMRRDGNVSDMRWFQAEPCFIFHVMNAWEDGERIIAYVVQYESAPLFPLPDGSINSAESRPRLCRWTFDLAASGNYFHREYVDDLTAEFPRIDDRFAGSKSRYGYYVAREVGNQKSGMFNSVIRADLKYARRSSFVLPFGDAISEPVFVPRDSQAEEGDGWILAIVFRGGENRSDLVVLDASAIDAGPVATAQLSHRIPFGFHGNWCCQRALNTP